MTPRILACAIVAVLAACDRDPPALTPPGGPEDFLRAADVLASAQCELDAAVARADPRFSASQAEITLSLVVQVSESTGGGVTLSIPIGGTDLTIRRDRVPEGTALRVMDFRISHTFRAIPICPSAEVPLTETGLRFIDGGLGLVEWISEVDRLVEHGGRVPREVNYAISFDVTISDERSPVFSRPIDTIDAGFTRQDAGAREVRHRIAVTIVPAPAGKGALQDAANRFLERIDD